MILKRCCLIVLLAGACQNALADDWIYTVRPGDDLWTIAREYCGSAKLAQQIATYNRMTNPAALRAGQRLTIPTNILAFAPASAVVAEVQGDVVLIKGTHADAEQIAAPAGEVVEMGDTVVTTTGAARVSFADQSDLSIDPNSRVLFNKLTAFGPAGMVDTHLRFAYGRGTSRVQPQNRGDRFRIETPEGVAAVRGTVFRVGYLATDKLANTETLEGEVGFTQLNNTTDVPSGYGVAASPNGVIKETLLPAPQFTTQQSTLANGIALGWQALPGASSFMLTWSTVAKPEVSYAQVETRDTFAIVDLNPGQYIARVRGISNARIHGFEASAEFTVQAKAPVPTSDSDFSGGDVRLSWQHDDAGPFSVTLLNELTQNTRSERTNNRSLDLDLTPGVYRWQVSGQNSASSTEQRISVRPAKPLNIGVRQQGRSLRIAWDAVKDATGYDLTLSSAGQNPLSFSTSETTATIDVPTFGIYKLNLASAHASLQSDEAETQVIVQRRPWWLLILAIPILAL